MDRGCPPLPGLPGRPVNGDYRIQALDQCRRISDAFGGAGE